MIIVNATVPCSGAAFTGAPARSAGGREADKKVAAALPFHSLSSTVDVAAGKPK